MSFRGSAAFTSVRGLHVAWGVWSGIAGLGLYQAKGDGVLCLPSHGRGLCLPTDIRGAGLAGSRLAEILVPAAASGD